MNPIAILKRVDFKNILKIIFIGLGTPLFVVPTLRATKDCMKISADLYGRLHHKNGPANAFRHALWNYLIAKRCYVWQKKPEKVMAWAKKITDWHENAFPNRELARKMDLHNNAVGRTIFEDGFGKTEAEIVEILKELAFNSIKIDAHSNLTGLKNQLVHIIDEA